MDKEQALNALGLDISATMEDIRDAYHKLSHKFHPDKSFHKGNTQEDSDRFRNIIDSYTYLRENFHHNIWITDKIDVTMTIHVPFETMITGGYVDIDLPEHIVCRDCHGTGIIKDPTYPCPKCNGTGSGSVKTARLELHTDCSECHGTGKGRPETCPSCGGSGVDDRQSRYRVIIPSGIMTGEQIIIEKQGRMNKDGQVGKLILNVQVDKHKWFSRKGDNLHISSSVSFTSLCLGGTTTVRIPGTNEVVSIDYEAGTPAGFVKKVERKGVRRNGTRGNLFIRLFPRVPKKVSYTYKKCLNKIEQIEKSERSHSFSLITSARSNSKK